MSAATSSKPAAAGNGASIARARKKRMLIIVNPYATTVSDRLKNLVVYALQGRYSVEAVETQARQHATQLCREATVALRRLERLARATRTALVEEAERLARAVQPDAKAHGVVVQRRGP